MAIDSHPNKAELKAPPLQKLPVDGHTAFWVVESKFPVTKGGTRHPNVAPTLCAPVGNHLPAIPIILALTPVSAEGNST